MDLLGKLSDDFQDLKRDALLNIFNDSCPSKSIFLNAHARALSDIYLLIFLHKLIFLLMNPSICNYYSEV
jgi:hypothetical protein